MIMVVEPSRNPKLLSSLMYNTCCLNRPNSNPKVRSAMRSNIFVDASRIKRTDHLTVFTAEPRGTSAANEALRFTRECRMAERRTTSPAVQDLPPRMQPRQLPNLQARSGTGLGGERLALGVEGKADGSGVYAKVRRC